MLVVAHPGDASRPACLAPARRSAASWPCHCGSAAPGRPPSMVYSGQTRHGLRAASGTPSAPRRPHRPRPRPPMRRTCPPSGAIQAPTPPTNSGRRRTPMSAQVRGVMLSPRLSTRRAQRLFDELAHCPSAPNTLATSTGLASMRALRSKGYLPGQRALIRARTPAPSTRG